MRSSTWIILAGVALGAASCTYRTPEEGEAKADKKENTQGEKDYLSIGNDIVAKVGGGLSATLQQKIKDEGIIEALDYCNIHALPITDSLAKANQAVVKRTSLKFRNAANSPTNKEQEILTKWKIDFNKGIKPEAFIQLNNDGTVSTFHPIFIGELCLKCHGVPGVDIDDDVFAELETRYPKDQATDYNLGDFRGMFVVTMSK